MEFINHNGIFLPGSMAKTRYNRPIAIDLFAGCGGFSLGFIQAGFEVVAAVEWDEWAALSYMVNLGSYPIKIHYIEPGDKERINKACEWEAKQWEKVSKHNSRWDTKYGLYNKATGSLLSGSGWIRNHPEYPPVQNFWVGDIRKVKGRDILDTLGLKPGDVDCVCGGPPCQGFSAAGKREVMDPRNSLVFEFARIILEIQPKTFIMENVPGIINMITPDGLPVLDEFCRILEDGGFAPMDALKKSLLASSGAGAAVKRSSYKKNREAKEAKKEVEQLSLLG